LPKGQGVKAQLVPKRPEHGFAPLSFSQLQMWLMDQMTPGNPAYISPVGYRLEGRLDAKALENSFNEVIKRHEVLRTTFAVRDEEPRQFIHPQCSVGIQITRLDHLPAEEREARLRLLAQVEATTPFDLSKLPLVRLSLFKLDETEHVLLVTLHHVVVDGVSIGLMLDEVDVLYRAFTGSDQGRLPELTVQYADFASWQRRTLPTRALDDQIAFWRRQLSGTLPVLELPSDLPRPPAQSFKGASVFFDIPSDLFQALSALGAREGCTLFTTLLAAFQVLLQRYSGSDEILIGTPVSRRTPCDLERLIGNFINMVALRCDLKANPTFLQILRRTRRMTNHAFSKADLPFQTVVENLTFGRDLSRNSIFQAMLDVLPKLRPRIGDLQISSFHFDQGVAQFDLSLHVCDDPGRHICRFEYCADLFKADTVERMSSNFVQLLDSIVRMPEQRLLSIPILTEPEKKQVVFAWNKTSRTDVADACVHRLFERAAAATPKRVALECAGGALTYCELNEQANRLANYLIALGVKPEDPIGVYLERSLNLVVALLGVLKAGAAYVPMDPSFPADRLSVMMDDAGISILVSRADLVNDLPVAERKAVCLDRDESKLRQQSSANPERPLRRSNLAYVIYTSGSTGRPKGVMIEHRSLVNLLISMQREPGFGPQDVLLAVTTISFDIAALEIFLPLISGGKVVIARQSDVIDGSGLIQLMKRSRATVLQGTPSTWKLLLQARWKGDRKLKMLCGGEPLPRALANTLLELGGELWNMYGPTETTIWSSAHRIHPGEGPVLIGPPIANTQFYIADRELQPVPIGVTGELLIGGDGLSRGYLNRPDLTAERFIRNGRLGSGGRVYKTGDLARFKSDGQIEFLGRLDSQTKVRGYRIELEEVEHVLAQHKDVRDVAVTAWEDGDGDNRLVAYYVPSNGKKPQAVELSKHLRQQLPDYMCPSFFVEIAALPLTPNGKVDRKAFPAPDMSALPAGSSHVAPRNELEERLAAIWQEVLKRQSIGVDDNFFELGGHSLLAARLFALIDKGLALKMPLAILFQAPTIRQLAETIQRRVSNACWSSLVPISTQGNGTPLFLIHGAEGNVLLYRNLADEMGPGQRLFGLQSRGLDGREQLKRSIESMAATYLTEIEAVQPKGPYYLAGYCLGGTIALEIAQRLRRSGERVALLAMLETYNVQSEPPASVALRTIHRAQNLYFQTRNLLLSLSDGSIKFLIEKLRVELSRFRVRCHIFYTRVMTRLNRDHQHGYQHLRIAEVNHEALTTYKPSSFDGRIVLFKPRVHYRGFNDQYFGWGSIAKHGVRVVDMPNYPRGSLNHPFVEILAHTLKAEIQETLDHHNQDRDEV
jgi:amino acid adenylation domain-containing protein